MVQSDRLLKKVQRELAKPLRFAAQAAALGYDVFVLTRTQGVNDLEAEGIVDAFRAYIKAYHLENMISDQIDYAMSLAEHDLDFEDMFKLFSLCDEIEALRQIGLEVDMERYADFQARVAERIDKQRKTANSAAGCRVEDWKRGWWWYSQILGKQAHSEVQK